MAGIPWAGIRPPIGPQGALPQHNRAAFVAYAERTKLRGRFHMRLLVGIVIGGALTVGGAYVADALSGPETKPMVNWDVVAKNVDSVTTLARNGWKRITG